MSDLNNAVIWDGHRPRVASLRSPEAVIGPSDIWKVPETRGEPLSALNP